MVCEICGERAAGQAYNLKWDEWQYLCPTCRDRENPNKWEAFKDDED
uniref:Uncharacterized protein n=1 Tax=viral metagenome TaxID=1070528 RepID=A0A6H2A428_9ZZZZ